MNKKIKNLEIKIAQNRGYTTELKKSVKALGGFSNEHAESIVENMNEIDKIKNAIQSIGKEFINLIDDKIAHNTARLHETHAKDVVEKILKNLNSKDIIIKGLKIHENKIPDKKHFERILEKSSSNELNKNMIKIRDKQLKRHYSGKEKHELCLTCEAIVNNKLINDFIKKLDGAIKFYHPNPTYLIKLKQEYNEKLK